MDEIMLADSLRAVTHRLARRLNAAAASDRMPTLHRDILAMLDLQDGLTSADLARRFEVTPQATNQAVAVLVGQGLLARRGDTEDRRRQLLSLTEPGRTAIGDVRTTKNAWLAERLVTRATGADRDCLQQAVTILQRLVEEH
ncbi:MarR family winged helix-turn-helix transcriptional regulator [Flexivirga alba]|uniref:MarR family winged helix-turn-helix transcriptional regulator n=1 Tax=Flexivirga alba TaxID=702742 RepID=A0ABW2ABN8_9MICO